MNDEAAHCKDCCCARSWKALGVTQYTGRSIPEHIEQLREALTTIIRQHDQDGCIAAAAFDAGREALAALKETP